MDLHLWPVYKGSGTGLVKRLSCTVSCPFDRDYVTDIPCTSVQNGRHLRAITPTCGVLCSGVVSKQLLQVSVARLCGVALTGCCIAFSVSNID